MGRNSKKTRRGGNHKKVWMDRAREGGRSHLARPCIPTSRRFGVPVLGRRTIGRSSRILVYTPFTSFPACPEILLFAGQISNLYALSAVISSEQSHTQDITYCLVPQ